MSSLPQLNSPTPTAGAGSGGAIPNPLPVTIEQIAGVVPSLTVDNLNVQLTHLGANPDSLILGNGTSYIHSRTIDATQQNDASIVALLGTYSVIAGWANGAGKHMEMYLGKNGEVVLGNDGGAIDFNKGAASTQTIRTVSSGATRTPAKSTVVASGSVTAGKQSVTFITNGAFTGTILGDTTAANAVLTFSVNGNDTLGALDYTITAGSIQILTVT